MFTINHAISATDSFVIERAVSFLVTQYNKSGHNPKPVILHSIRVASLLIEMGYSKNIIIGAVLHDILEDTATTHQEVLDAFGEDILDLIQAVSYDDTITDPTEQYKDMYDRIMRYGKDAIVLKAADIALNSLYIPLVTDPDKRKHLVEKGSYFLDLTKEFSNEPSWLLLKQRNLEEIAKLS